MFKRIEMTKNWICSSLCVSLFKIEKLFVLSPYDRQYGSYTQYQHTLYTIAQGLNNEDVIDICIYIIDLCIYH